MGFVRMCVCFLCFFFSFFLNSSLFYSPVCFLKRKRKQTWSRVWGDGEDLKGEEGGETVIKIYCLKIIYFR